MPLHPLLFTFYTLLIKGNPPLSREESNAKTGRQWQIHEKLDFSVYAGVYAVISFVSLSAKFGICTVVGLNGTLVEAKIRI
jgi:hypothetical protein